MPAIFDHLEKHYHLSAHDAWRRAFFIPFALIMTTAFFLVLLCPDTPVGKWSERGRAVEENLRAEHQAGHAIAHSGIVHDRRPSHVSHTAVSEKDEKLSGSNIDVETKAGEVVEVDAEYTHEVIQKPTPKEMLKIMVSPQTLVLMACYFNSFGSELSINAILGAYYLKNFPKLGQTSSGRWAAMFGILNIYGRPIGGIVSDLLYKYTGGSLWAKKVWVHTLGLIMGVFMLAIGLTDSHHRETMVGLIAGLACKPLTKPLFLITHSN
jgi:NNP family nitrate/nitrite transporter-like MFS transporter